MSHEHNEVVKMLIEISDELYNATEALRHKDYIKVSQAANSIKNISHTCYAVAFNLKRKEIHG